MNDSYILVLNMQHFFPKVFLDFDILGMIDSKVLENCNQASWINGSIIIFLCFYFHLFDLI